MLPGSSLRARGWGLHADPGFEKRVFKGPTLVIISFEVSKLIHLVSMFCYGWRVLSARTSHRCLFRVLALRSLGWVLRV